MNGMESKLIVITGCDSGIGKSLAEVMLKRGYSVAVSYLDKNHFEEASNAYPWKMDVMNTEEVDAFCSYVKELCRGGIKLEAVVMNAGIAITGPVENLPMDFYRKCMEINFFAPIRMIKEFIPEIIRNKGRIMVIGSLAGKIALPFLSAYASSKYAAEAFCDSLRRELNPFGVKTILMEPAAVATPIWNKGKAQDISFVDEKYRSCLTRERDSFVNGGNSGVDADVAAFDISQILMAKNPRPRYIIAKNLAVSKLLLIVPDRILDKAIEKVFHMDYGNKGKKGRRFHERKSVRS
ncbi:MAG TPA: SDR family NAD(P)-dependent oxidoreductase [Clostridiaceae bacterium]